MAREVTVDWPWPGEWESVEDVSNFYKDELYEALCNYVGGLAESDTHIDYVVGPLTIGDLTIGSVMFAGTGGVVTQDNDDFYWDATNIRLGINVGTSPSVTLDVSGDCKFDGAVIINEAGEDKDFRVESLNQTHAFFLDASSDLIGIRESAPTALLHIDSVGGSIPALNLESGAEGELVTPDGQQLRIGHWDGSSTFTERLKIDDAGKFYVSYLTTGSVIFAGANGEIKQDNDKLFWDATNYWLGIGHLNPLNPLHVSAVGTVYGWGGAYGGVVAQFNCTESKHTIIAINANTGYDPTLVFSEYGSAVWDIRNDATEDNFEVRYQVGGANSTYFTIGTTGNVEIVAGKLSMDTAIATAIDIGNSFTGSQVTMTGSSATDHAVEIDGVYGGSLIYTHTSSATADTLLWGDMASTATSGDFNGLRPRLTCNAASGGLNARAVYGEVIVGASKYAALAQGVLAHASYAAGSCKITDIHALGAHISQGASLTATNLYGIIATIQTRGDESISGNDYVMRLENEAVGGNGRQMDGAIQIVNTNMGDGTSGYGYGLDLSGADIATADIILQNNETISNAVDGLIDFGAGDLSTIGTFAAEKITIVSNTREALIIRRDDMLRPSFYACHDTGYIRAIIDCYRSRNTFASPTAVVNGDYVGDFIYKVYDGDSWEEVAGFGVRMDGAVADEQTPAHLFFRTRASGDASLLAERMRLSPEGNLGLNQTSFGTNAVGLLALGTGTAPTTSPADCFQMYSADIGGTAGKAGVHFRGEDNNVVSIGSGGVLMSGTARVTKQIYLNNAAFTKGTTAPTQVILGDLNGWEFDIGDDAVMTIMLPPDWASATDVTIKVCWYIDEAYASDKEVQWRIDWSAIPHDFSETVDAPTHSGQEDSGDINIPTNAKEMGTSTIGTISGNDLSAGDMLGFTLSRIDVTNDDPTDDPVVHHLIIEHTADKLGIAT